MKIKVLCDKSLLLTGYFWVLHVLWSDIYQPRKLSSESFATPIACINSFVSVAGDRCRNTSPLEELTYIDVHLILNKKYQRCSQHPPQRSKIKSFARIINGCLRKFYLSLWVFNVYTMFIYLKQLWLVLNHFCYCCNAKYIAKYTHITIITIIKIIVLIIGEDIIIYCYHLCYFSARHKRKSLSASTVDADVKWT